MFAPVVLIPMWITTKNGAKIFLGTDPIDDTILAHLLDELEDRYFPDYLHLRPGDKVLDVGGHHGLFAVEILARFPGIKIVTIEPDPRGIETIKKHIRKNDAHSDIQIVPFAVGEGDGTGYLAESDDGSWGKTLEDTAGQGRIPVKVKKLETMIGAERLNIKLIKSNCEGGEFDLIPQMIELGLKPELIILMIHPDRGDLSALTGMLARCGYDATVVTESDTHPCWHFRLNYDKDLHEAQQLNK
jgi:FkbM family methyltransferase